jgi:outer membrane lipoprotein-sorting protein
MPKHRILPAIGVSTLIPLVAWAQPPAAPSAAAPAAPAGSVQAAQAQAAAAAKEPPTEAENALDEATKKVAALKSVKADLNEQVDMLDQRFTVQGQYLKAPGHRIYLKLTVSGLPDATAQMLQVCDGQTLWDFQQVIESQRYDKLEIGLVLEKLKAPELDDTIRAQVTTQFGLGGPDELLRGLRNTVRFDQKVADTLDGKSVWKLTGEWKSRDGLIGPNPQALPMLGLLPAYIPSLVTVWVGQDDGWPYKVRLVGRRPTKLIDTRRRGPDGRPIGSQSSIQEVKPTDITLVYSNVELNPELKIDEFVFTAPQGARVEDRTQQLVGGLDQLIQLRAAQKKSEAGKAEDAVLDQSLTVPKAGTAPAPAEPRPAAPTPGGAPK